MKVGVFVCYVFCTHLLLAQQLVGGYMVRHYAEKDGLPGGDYQHMLIDLRGNIWVTNFEGIIRFDGRNFTNYTSNNGIIGKAIYDLKMDKTGNLYVFSEGNIQRFTESEPHPFSSSLYVVPDTLTESIQPIDNNRFWIIAGSHPGLYLASKGKVLPIAHINDHIGFLDKDKYGYVYATSREQRIWVLKDTVVQGVINIPITTTGSYWTDVSPDGKFWYTDSRNVYQITGQHIERTIPLPKPQKDACISIGQRSGKIYYGIDTIYKFQDGSWSRMQLPTMFGYIYDMKEDASGTLWLATNRGIFSISSNPIVSLPGQRTLSFTRQNNETLLNTTLLERPDKQRINGYSYAYISDSKMQWYCTPRDGLYYSKPSSNELKRYVSPDTSVSIGNDKKFLKAIDGSLGTVWFSSYNGIDRYKNGRFQHFGTSKGLTSKAIYDLAVNNKGQVFAATNGLCVYDTGRFKLILKEQFGKSIVYSIANDSKGNVWAMNKSGRIYKVQSSGNHYYPTDSLQVSINGNSVSSICFGFDLHDNLWVVAKRYLIIFRPDKQGSYHNENKLVLPAINEENGKLACGTDGNMYFYNAGGTLQYINTESVILSALSAPLVSNPYFTTITIIKKKLPSQLDSLSDFKDISNKESLKKINYSDNDIEFRFIANSASFPDEVRYRYMLQGLDSTWQQPKVYGRATYIDIPPGNFTLLVQAADARNNWTPSISFSFTILPPWYNTWWGYILEAATVMLAAFFMFSWGLQVNKKRSTIQRLFTEQQLKTIRAQINPHFLHNIFSFLARKLQEDSTMAVDSLTTLSNYVREVLYATDKAVVSLEDEILFTEKYFRIQQLLLNYVFTYKITVEDKVDTLGLKVPSMLLQPIVENACKYGIDKKKNVNFIHLIIAQSADYVCCSLIDTGSTNPKPTLHPNYTSKGLTLTKERLLLLYKDCKKESSISMLSNDQGGMTVNVYLPLC